MGYYYFTTDEFLNNIRKEKETISKKRQEKPKECEELIQKRLRKASIIDDNNKYTQEFLETWNATRNNSEI